jgi:hypothetical protein
VNPVAKTPYNPDGLRSKTLLPVLLSFTSTSSKNEKSYETTIIMDLGSGCKLISL